MTDTPTASEGGHWYAKDGTPVYRVPTADGKKLRDATLRDARKLALAPGFSTIARLEYKPALERWKIDQALMAALTLPHIDGETLEAFKARAEADSQAQAEKARHRGVELHGALEAFYQTGETGELHAPYVMPVVNWLAMNVPTAAWVPEKSFTHPAGYGGKTDLYSPGVALVDFKFKDFTAEDVAKKKIKGYDEHEMQLHAYAHGLFEKPNRCRLINLFISSTVPGLFVPVEWPWRAPALTAFFCLLDLWQIRKDYCPEWAK
jgi:hypothetical protein